MFCAKVRPMVDGLEKTYGDRMDFSQKEYTSEEGAAEIASYDLDTHGMIIIGPDGSTHWKESGHKQELEVVEAQIKQVLGVGKSTSGGG
ncbi:MAG: hypothetical protein O7H41_12730 [Planctomycetota bacterium]|nr:hypothetical protein [Planctomycetota bacterium]